VPQVELLQIRRWFTVCAGVLGSACTVAFATARRPRVAALWFCGVTPGLGCIVAFHDRSPTLYQIRSHIQHLSI
jgi:hypothetical protein